MLSHETACLLNSGSRHARVAITLHFADQDPVGPYEVVVPAWLRALGVSAVLGAGGALLEGQPSTSTILRAGARESAKSS